MFALTAFVVLGARFTRCAQKLKLTDWMLLMCKLSEMQMSEKMKAVAEEADPLKEQLQTLVADNKQQLETIEQQKSVISGINTLLKESAK